MSFSQKLISNKTEKFLQFMNKYENGFSLLEVAAALLILSTTVIILFQFILDTQVSTTSFQDKVIAREIAPKILADSKSVNQISLEKYNFIKAEGLLNESREEIIDLSSDQD